jgi:hypothetical protein
MLEYGHMHIQCFKIPPKSTNPALVHLQTRDGLQSSSKLLQGSKSASKNPLELKLAPPKSTNLRVVHLQTPNGLQILNAPPKLFKTPPSLQKCFNQCKLAPPTHTNPEDISLKHTSNQTSNDAICMCGPITYWD